MLIFSYVTVKSQEVGKCDTIKTSGRILDEVGDPLPGVSIKSYSDSFIGTTTNMNGEFSLRTCKDDVLLVSFLGYNSGEIRASNKFQEYQFTSAGLQAFLPGSASSSSLYSYWSGAKVGYNINVENGGTGEIVGGSSVIINKFTKKYFNARWDIVGNIGNFASTDVSNDETQQKLVKLAQEETGLSIGLGGTWEKPLGEDDEFTLRPFFNTSYKLNTFKVANKNADNTLSGDTSNVALNQWHNSLGVELEGFDLLGGGKVHLGFGVGIDLFSKDRYNTIFNKRRGSFTSLAASLILPLSDRFGFLVDGNYSKRFHPVYTFGIVIRNLEEKKKE
nr:carboxypeptidase-like regulatory domain-containing protein [Pedobacter xinjiangensis]